MSLEAQKKEEARGESSETGMVGRFVKSVSVLREVARDASAKGSVEALHRIATVMDRLPPQVQQFLHNSVVEGVVGLPVPDSNDPHAHTKNVIASLYGISSVTNELKGRIEK